MKPGILLGSSIVVLFILISAVAFINKKTVIPENLLEVRLRNIGHQLLLSSKDSTSRVLPIQEIEDNKYQISFQNNFGLVSDSLINIVEREFHKTSLSTNYIVRLKNCNRKETVLAFEINKKTGNLIPCRGRKLEAGCYFIEIDFYQTNQFNFSWLLLLFLPLGFVGYYAKDKFRKKETTSVVDDGESIQIGVYRFNPNHHSVTLGENNITLSENENKALIIFSQHINQIVDREKLMKEIWEDQGIVVISRNVDVLVSKLRKKLSDDPSIKFNNVHGRGYKLTVDS
jgi:DNA-binding winged helix-turn-helix (wHTH) protein